MEEPKKAHPSQADEDDLTVEYANNLFFSPNVWDLKIIFGELAAFKQAINWHTSITLPWEQAKLMAYYLAINIAAHELEKGPIIIPKAMLPQEPPPPTDSPSDRALFEMVRKHRQQFIDSQKK
jgi:hypothetical protein